MKKILEFLLLATTGLILTVSCTVMSQETLMDKIKGGWAGQTIGCTYGGPTEFYFRGRMIPDSVKIEWPEHYIKYYFQKFPGLYDDVYMDLTFVDVFDKKGLDAPIEEFANAFANAPYPLWHANLQGRVNILAGMTPPETGYWMNNPHADDIDFQIEADYAGLMSPAMPNAATYYCDGIGHMMNYGDGWYGGVWVATMYSLAFMYDDIETIVRKSLDAIPANSRYAECISNVIKWHEEYPDDWKKTWQLFQDNCTPEAEANCPDEPGNPLRIDAEVNGAYIAIGLLYGEGDFDKTIEIATRCGQDSDCNPANAAGILATMLGYSAIPEKYLVDVQEMEDVPFEYTDISLNKVYQMSYNQALQVIERNGGKVGKDKVRIPRQKIVPVRYEKSFEGIRYKEYIHIDKRAFGEDNDIRFEFDGCGLVLTGRLDNRRNGDYEAIVDIEIDGEQAGPSVVTEVLNTGQDHIFHKYDLEQGHHSVRLSVRNPEESKKLRVYRAIIYEK